MPKKITTQEFIRRAKLIHGEVYDYSMTIYTGAHDYVEILCKEHGLNKQTAWNHLQGHALPCCAGFNKNNDTIIKEFKSIHGSVYDYSLVKYKNSTTKVSIICKTHGIFEQTPHMHVSGQGCPVCSKNYKLTTETFIIKARAKHSSFYSYHNVEYYDSIAKVEITCPHHGSFMQSPREHLRGKGCPVCARNRKLVGREERNIFQPWILKLFPDVIFQHKFESFPYYVDAYIPKMKLVIEFDEPHHGEPKRIENDIIRQGIIEKHCDVIFYRINQINFEEEKENFMIFLENFKRSL